MTTMFLPTGERRWTGSRWYYEILGEDNEFVTVKLFDDAYSRPIKITYRDYDGLVIRYGLWVKTGMYQFNRADDPAVRCVRYATQYPQDAGRELYHLRKMVDKMKTDREG